MSSGYIDPVAVIRVTGQVAEPPANVMRQYKISTMARNAIHARTGTCHEPEPPGHILNACRSVVGVVSGKVTGLRGVVGSLVPWRNRKANLPC